ncbi:MAG: hypothetical protein LQ350_006246 [Teloschistes chrysophthalmus]|nr:MAG: hypothetical protein LQ350_006246 [Niorma chrysophthalma]
MVTSNHDSSTKDDEARLIVTFFVKSRPSNVSSQSISSDPEPFRSQSLACGPTFSSLLSPRVAPAPLTLSSSRTLAQGIFQSVYSVTAPFPNPAKFRHHASIAAFEALHALEIVFDLLPLDVCFAEPLRPVRLAVFDMDSTLIDQEVIDELARSIGITDAVASITARAMNGEIEFEQSLRERLALLKGVKADVWEDLKHVVTIAKGARKLIGYLRERGVMTVVVSGGFAPMANWLKEQLGLSFAYANHLIVSPSDESFPYPHLSGDLSPDHPIVVPEYKRHVLETLAKEHSIPLSETLVVGDGSNDLLMLGAAGLGVAWRAKERVQKEAPQRLNGTTLSDLIYLLGGHAEEHKS